MALKRRRPASGTIHHSDQGSQYTSKAYQRQLADAGLVVSMSRKGMPYDNAVMESFFRLPLPYLCFKPSHFAKDDS